MWFELELACEMEHLIAFKTRHFSIKYKFRKVLMIMRNPLEQQ